MARIGHGEVISEAFSSGAESVANVSSSPSPAPFGLDLGRILPESGAELAALAVEANADEPDEVTLDERHRRYGYMFPKLQADPANLLAEGPETLAALRKLGEAMVDDTDPRGRPSGINDTSIPSGFTYFGQFLDHDLTADTNSATIGDLSDPGLQPLATLDHLVNGRTCRLDLDSVYGGDHRVPGTHRLLVGRVSASGNRPPGKSDFNDLPRKPRDDDPRVDREALIGDPRNDENLIISQLHTAFLKSHNAFVAGGANFDRARQMLRRRYQWIVLHDFLGRVLDPAVHKDIVANGPSFWRIRTTFNLFMPAEFAVAAYRFGHSMIRTGYSFNANFPGVGLDLLFTFTALSGGLGGFDTLPENWIIDWPRFVGGGPTPPPPARAIDTLLTQLVFDLPNVQGQPLSGDFPTGSNAAGVAGRLAVRNLLRGYRFRLPTGQAVAGALGLSPLAGQALIDALPNAALKAAAEPFKDRTPLWFYILAEAGDPNGPKGQHLGVVGSRIVGETLWNLIRHSKHSILQPGIDLPFDDFTLVDLIETAKTQEGQTAP